MTVKEQQGERERAKEIGRRIALSRKEADGMTQRELADLIGVTERSIAAYESGDVIPYRFIRQLEAVLDKPASWLLHGDQSSPEADELKATITALTTQVETLTQVIEEWFAKQRTLSK